MNRCQKPHLRLFAAHAFRNQFSAVKTFSGRADIFPITNSNWHFHFISKAFELFFFQPALTQTHAVIFKAFNIINITSDFLSDFINRMTFTHMNRHKMKLHFTVLANIFSLIHTLADGHDLLSLTCYTATWFPRLQNSVKKHILHFFRAILLFINNLYCPPAHFKNGTVAVVIHGVKESVLRIPSYPLTAISWGILYPRRISSLATAVAI